MIKEELFTDFRLYICRHVPRQIYVCIYVCIYVFIADINYKIITDFTSEIWGFCGFDDGDSVLFESTNPSKRYITSKWWHVLHYSLHSARSEHKRNL